MNHLDEVIRFATPVVNLSDLHLDNETCIFLDGCDGNGAIIAYRKPRYGERQGYLVSIANGTENDERVPCNLRDLIHEVRKHVPNGSPCPLLNFDGMYETIPELPVYKIRPNFGKAESTFIGMSEKHIDDEGNTFLQQAIDRPDTVPQLCVRTVMTNGEQTALMVYFLSVDSSDMPRSLTHIMHELEKEYHDDIPPLFITKYGDIINGLPLYD